MHPATAVILAHGSAGLIWSPVDRRMGTVSQQNPLEISWTRSAGSALGAVSSAVLLSTLGVAGTLTGAALGSLVITVGGTIYSNSLQATRQRVLKSTVRGDQPSARARDDRNLGDAADIPAQEHTSAPLPELDDPRPGTPWRQVLRDLPWKHITWVAAALFTVAMALILAFELTTGRAVSSYTGGSSTNTRSSIPGFDGSDTQPNQPTPSEAPTTDPEQQQTEAPQDEQTEVPQDEQQTEAPQDQQQTEAPQDQQQTEAPLEAPPTDAPQQPENPGG